MEFDFRQHPGRRRLDRELRVDGEPLITIITPYYNAGAHVRETAHCVLNQTFPYFEWIVVNDGSTREEDVRVLEEIAAEDPRIRVLHKPNGGMSSARNAAIADSRTDLIVSLDADDLIDPTYLECGYFTLLTNPDAAWCYADSIGFGSLEYVWKRPFRADILKKENFLVEVAMMRKSALEQVGGYGEKEKYFFEDWHLWLKFLSAGMRPVHMSFYGSWYRRSDSGVLGTIVKDPHLHERSLQIIREAAEHVDDSIRAVEFPIRTGSQFAKPTKWKWDRPPRLGSKRCKVLLMLPWMNMGGADRFNLDLIAKCDPEQFEFFILTTIPCDYVWRQKFERHTVEIFDLTTFLHPKHWSSFVHYFIQSRGIDLLFISNSYYAYYLAPWLKKEFPRLPIVDYVHLEEWYWRNGGYARSSQGAADVLDRTYVCSQHLKQVMIDTFERRPEEVEVVYLNVDEQAFDPTRWRRGEIREEAGVHPDDPVVLYPCRVHPQKRPFLLLEIADRVRREIPNVRFFVVGDGESLPELKQRTGERDLWGTVYFFGNRDEIARFYRDADLTLICSIKEGLALTVYESLAMGVPVVSGDVGGQRELVDESVGRLIPCLQDERREFYSKEAPREEVEQYAQAVCELLRDRSLRERLGAQGRKKIVNGFKQRRMIERMQAEFRAWRNGRRWKPSSRHLQALPRLIDEHLTLYNEFQAKDAELEQLWNGSQWERRELLKRVQELEKDRRKSREQVKQLMEKQDELIERVKELKGERRVLRQQVKELKEERRVLRRRLKEN